MNEARVSEFLGDVGRWASVRDDIQAVALVGSHARGTARDDSDIDLVVLTDNPRAYLHDSSWVQTFGNVASVRSEHYGRVTSLRVHYAHQLEVEFSLTDAEWAAVPLDPGTREVMSGGIQVLFERWPLLSRHMAKGRRIARADDDKIRQMEMTEKQRAIEALQSLPEHATLDDAIERLCFVAKIEEGLRQSEARELVSHDEVKKQFLA